MSGSRPWRVPTREDLARAINRRVPDVIAPGLRVLFVGINPGLYTAAVGHHFARPGNRFWPTLHRAGFTPRQLHPSEERELLALGHGITNLVARPSLAAHELTRDELVAGGRRLVAKVKRYEPRWVAVIGVTAYRVAFGRPDAPLGPQRERMGDARVWVLPNTSGLNAHHRPVHLVRLFAELHAAVTDRSQPS
jgi:TDG/mug DNA glycosylase family protein